MTFKQVILKIAVQDIPILECLDYLPPRGVEIQLLKPGIRLRVPLGGGKRIGLLFEMTDSTEIPQGKLKPAFEILDSTPLLPADSLELLRWVSNYYHHPIGNVVTTALPSLLNQGYSAHVGTWEQWRLTLTGQEVNLDSLTDIQRGIITLLHDYPQGLNKNTISYQFPEAAKSLRSMEKKGWLIAEPSYLPETVDVKHIIPLQLNEAQQQIVNQVSEHLFEFYPCLLDGVTGSGKTEVYLHLIHKILLQNRQALVLVPEINLTPQMVNRFQQRFSVPIAVLHSKLNDKERLRDWLLARDGKAPIVIGTRSAVWTPLARPGLLVVDEEHDLSYKQQSGLLYSARDVAVWRARQAQVPILLGSATPSLDALYNAQRGRYYPFVLPERAGNAVHPIFQRVDMRLQTTKISRPLKIAIQNCLENRQQVLLFINRRGYAPTFMCSRCHWVAKCQRCDANLTYHESIQRLYCHHCGVTRRRDPVCPNCQHDQLHLLGQGTERVEESLQTLFPNAHILRVDSDSTRRKHAMEKVLEKVHGGEADILVGTQMLAKGHHFPKVTLVGIINLDGGFFSADFRATERMAQLLIQVAGRAGRADDPGRVIIQTYYPEHPLLLQLIQQGYGAFAQQILAERQQTEFPPYSYLALLRAEGESLDKIRDFLHLAKTQILQWPESADVEVWGPASAPMERREERYRMHLLFKAFNRKALHQLLRQWLPSLSNQVRWSLDVDPQDLL